MTTEEKLHIVLRITTEENKQSFNYHTFHVKVEILATTGLYPRTFAGTERYPENPAHFYDRLTIDLCTFADRDEASLNFVTYYDQPFHVDSSLANKHAKTFARLERGLAKIRDAEGECKSFGQHCNRIARIIGATWIAVRNDSEQTARTGDEYAWRTIGDGVSSIDNLTWSWFRRLERAKASPEYSIATD